MADDGKLVAVSAYGENSRLGEGFCAHCGAYNVFKHPDPAVVTRQLSEKWDGDEHVFVNEQFLFGICLRPTCRLSTVVRRVYTEVAFHGDRQDPPPDQIEIIFPVPKSAREPLPPQVPEDLRKKYNEACAIEFLSPTSAGFMAARLVDQAIRHRLTLLGSSRRRIRKATLADLIQEFLKHATGSAELRDMLDVVKGFRNVAAHPPQPEDAVVVGIVQEEASFLIDSCAELMEFVYARPARIDAMKQRMRDKKRPPLPSAIVLAEGPQPAPKEFRISDDDVPF